MLNPGSYTRKMACFPGPKTLPRNNSLQNPQDAQHPRSPLSRNPAHPCSPTGATYGSCLSWNKSSSIAGLRLEELLSSLSHGGDGWSCGQAGASGWTAPAARTERPATARHSLEQHGVARRGTAQNSTARRGTAWNGTARWVDAAGSSDSLPVQCRAAAGNARPVPPAANEVGTTEEASPWAAAPGGLQRVFPELPAQAGGLQNCPVGEGLGREAPARALSLLEMLGDRSRTGPPVATPLGFPVCAPQAQNEISM